VCDITYTLKAPVVWQVAQAMLPLLMWPAGLATAVLNAPAVKPVWHPMQSPVAGCALSAGVMPFALAVGRSTTKLFQAEAVAVNDTPASWHAVQPLVMPAWPVAPIVYTA
jgi:hypothetical protein